MCEEKPMEEFAAATRDLVRKGEELHRWLRDHYTPETQQDRSPPVKAKELAEEHVRLIAAVQQAYETWARLNRKLLGGN
jgi:hypothetical protein